MVICALGYRSYRGYRLPALAGGCSARQTLPPPQPTLGGISKRCLVICTPPDARGSILRDCNHLWSPPHRDIRRINAPFAGTICSTPFLKSLLFEHGGGAHSTKCVERLYEKSSNTGEPPRHE